MEAGEFYYLPSRQAWVFTNAPRRSMTAKARWFMEGRKEYAHVDYTGEPVVWECCIFCGGDLPGVPSYYGPSLQQADGEGEVGG